MNPNVLIAAFQFTAKCEPTLTAGKLWNQMEFPLKFHFKIILVKNKKKILLKLNELSTKTIFNMMMTLNNHTGNYDLNLEPHL